MPAGASHVLQLGFRCQVILHLCLAIGQFFGNATNFKTLN